MWWNDQKRGTRPSIFRQEELVVQALARGLWPEFNGVRPYSCSACFGSSGVGPQARLRTRLRLQTGLHLDRESPRKYSAWTAKEVRLLGVGTTVLVNHRDSDSQLASVGNLEPQPLLG